MPFHQAGRHVCCTFTRTWSLIALLPVLHSVIENWPTPIFWTVLSRGLLCTYLVTGVTFNAATTRVKNYILKVMTTNGHIAFVAIDI
jgi:hypothetical protein